MIWLVGLLAYTAATVGASRLLAGHFAWCFYESRDRYLYRDKDRSQPSSDQWFGAWCLALMVAVLWPFAIVAFAAGKNMAVGAEARSRSRKQAQRIKELEKELELS